MIIEEATLDREMEAGLLKLETFETIRVFQQLALP